MLQLFHLCTLCDTTAFALCWLSCCLAVQVAEARKLLIDSEIERSLSGDRVVQEAVRAAQQDGIVFIDEIDKIVETSRGVSGATSE
jgi:ATP-dependent protease HslVU (ClpYQ) ATPase subunit